MGGIKKLGNAKFYALATQRYDLKGKKILSTLSKFYAVDLGFKHITTNKPVSSDIGHKLENAVYFELFRRYPRVYIGKIAEYEVDFVAQNYDGSIELFQVAATVRDENTRKRELRALDMVKVAKSKTLITLDPEELHHNGVDQVNAVNWLLGNGAAKLS
ncbi:hypothetical protein FACS1894125_0070 [Actinomycetota bacterium]|nr:hypothetical protein FACS1894125_0070 [Actinomycetota bacterium]